MSGIINDTSGDAASPDAAGAANSGGGLSNPLLQQIEAKLEANIVDPATKENYMRIVVAGLHIALEKGPDGGMASLRNSRDPVGDAARGAVALVLAMKHQAKGVMPPKAMIPAGMTLMFHALDFLDRAGVVKVSEPEIDSATRTFTNLLFQKLGITTAILQRLTGRVHQITQDPASMAAINLKAGVTRHPNAATPTPLPSGPPGMINGSGAGETQ